MIPMSQPPRAPEPERPDPHALGAEYARPLPSESEPELEMPLFLGTLPALLDGRKETMDIKICQNYDSWNLEFGPYELNARATANLIRVVKIVEEIFSRSPFSGQQP